ncbi:MAG: hypothetical protein IPK83_24885 [Planctomycetes bacterium]|nr:hypothetical protein [Planctomycetota bacterium]
MAELARPVYTPARAFLCMDCQDYPPDTNSLAPRQIRAHVFALKTKNRLDALKLGNWNFPFLKPSAND